MLRRDRSSKASARQSVPPQSDSFIPVYFEDNDKGLSLFDSNYNELRPDLELPIKIETRNFQRQRRQSDSYSEDPHFDLLKDEKEPFQQLLESEDLMLSQRVYDPIDELLQPLEHNEQASALSFHMELSNEGERLSEHPLNEEQLAQQEVERMLAETPVSAEFAARRKLLLFLINDFHAYGQSLDIVMNFHTLLRKDSVTKMYGSILNVLKKENRKMEIALLEELKHMVPSKMPIEEELVRPDRKELFRTMADENALVKEEYID